jgi:diaminopimelate epimerase
MQFSKYHALGNDYIVINPADINTELTCQKIVGICHRNFGVGSDGILLGPYDSESCKFKLKIFNPDGSEAEKSGNGLRIFARYLWDNGLVSNAPFTLETLGGVVTCEVSSDGKSVKVKMGKVSFDSTIIPVNGEPREVLNEQIEIDGKIIVYCAATVGNPHCVIVTEYPTAEETQRLGPQIETNTLFPNRTNVQFMKVLDQNNIQIEIWERGAGYTLASGSSSTAAAAVAHRLGLCKSDIYVHMPGGIIEINLDDDFVATMTGRNG